MEVLEGIERRYGCLRVNQTPIFSRVVVVRDIVDLYEGKDQLC